MLNLKKAEEQPLHQEPRSQSSGDGIKKNHLSCIFENVRATAPVTHPPRRLPPDFVPSMYDVICAKGKRAFNSIGNRRFRVIIDMHLKRYSKATTKLEKSSIVSSIVDLIRSVALAGFVKLDDGGWIEVGDVAAREKVGQTIRDVLSQRDPEKRARRDLREAKRKARKAEASPEQRQEAEGTCNKGETQDDLQQQPQQGVESCSIPSESKKQQACVVKKSALHAEPPMSSLSNWLAQELFSAEPVPSSFLLSEISPLPLAV